MSQSIRSGIFYSFTLFTLMMCISTISKANSAQLLSGGYCPDSKILLIVAEDLSSSLDFVMQSLAAQSRGDQDKMQSALEAASVTLKQATSRGAGARTALLIHSAILSRVNENNKQLLTWFPLIRSALFTLPDDVSRRAASHAIGRAEDILQGDQDGDSLEQLRKARHFLTCDGLDLPLQAAIKGQVLLLSRIQQNKPVVTKDYDKIVDSLRTAMSYALGRRKT